jgi:NAD(P)-dependent dehydrogenase (short-subunit alcohol dehydrogenase family)
MVTIDLTGKSVLITGGTKGIGLSSALYFGKAGAQTYLTYKWGSDDYSALYEEFDKAGAPKPVLIQADVSVEEDTDALLSQIKEKEDKIDFFISNVGFAQSPKGLMDYKKRSLYKTLDYSTWPMIEYTQKIKKTFGQFPKHILGISSDGPSHFYYGYDFVAASKALLEFFGRYMAAHLGKDGSQVNVVRFGPVKTESFTLIFGEDFFDFAEKEGLSDDVFLLPDDCGRVVFALCSGLFDAMNGQVITVDKGLPFVDNFMNRYLAYKANK